ncbi:MAG: T9SS type A sorting domain-containing protein [Saprospiraceae bacterium]
MKIFCTIFAIIFLFHPLFGQANDPAPDTLLQHTFEGTFDPADTMLTSPTGNDLLWVNYDQDNKIGRCVSNGFPTPKGWYWESDLGFVDPNMTENSAFTSCSFLDHNTPQNKNWLITSPVYIPDSSYWLCWRSLSYYGPGFMDGYKVLASTSTNFPAAFNDTLFMAAQMVVHSDPAGSLEIDDYIFSPGYIHANGYTDTAYFFIDTEPLGDFYHGKLEPHSLSLAAYADQTIYIAFLHDSYDDFQLQVDDILVTNTKVSATYTLSNLLHFNILPNPVHDFAFVNWRTQTPMEGRLSVVDQSGKIVFERNFNSRAEGQIHLDMQGFARGVYFCKLETATGQATKMLVKI